MQPNLKDKIRTALIFHAKGQIAKHKINVIVLMENAQVVAEHPDVMETIEKELDSIATYEDRLDVLNKHF